MNAVDAFSAQMWTMGYSGGPTPTPPTWPTGAPAYPTAPVVPAQPVGQPQQPAGQGYWYGLPAGNPERLTVAQVVAKAYKLDPTRDKAQIEQISSYVAQQNGIMLSNWPIPNNVTGLRLPWAPADQGGKAQDEKPKKKGPNFGQVMAGITTIAAGAARIFARHNGQGMPTSTYGYPQYGQPTSGNRDVDLITGDIADAVPILANLGAILNSDAPPVSNGQPGYYGQPPYGQPTYGQPSYSPIPTGTYQPTPPVYPGTYQPPVYQQPQPYNPPIYQPPVYQQPQPYNPPIYQPPVYQQPQPYIPPGYQQPTYGQPGTYGTMGGDPWSNQVGTIINGVNSLAQTIGAIFKK